MGLLELGEKIEQEVQSYKDLRDLQHASDFTTDILATLESGRKEMWKGAEAGRDFASFVPKDAPAVLRKSPHNLYQQHANNMIECYDGVKKVIDDRIAEIRGKILKITNLLVRPRKEKNDNLPLGWLMEVTSDDCLHVRVGMSEQHITMTDYLILTQAELIHLNELLGKEDSEEIIKFLRCAMISRSFTRPMGFTEEFILANIKKGKLKVIFEHGNMTHIYFDRPDLFPNVEQKGQA